ncbi:MAG: hypothetical protein GSR85_03045 [Desulfurococcales archaeon]|nr:hypothetical protein [Desulfurococcales archaeon]
MQSSSLEDVYIHALSMAKKLPKPELGEDSIISFSGGAEPPAFILYRALLHSGVKAQLASASEVGVHIIPYRETGPLILFNVGEKDSRVIHTLEAASLLGIRAYLISPPMHPAYEEKVESLGVERILIDSRYPLLVMSLSSLFWSPRMMGGREGRFRAELGELESAFSWIASKIKGLDHKEARNVNIVFYTPSMAPGAYYHCYTLPTCIQPAQLEYALRLGRGARGIAYINGVEEHDYKDVIITTTLKGVKLSIVKLDTDPVTSGLYAILAAISLTGTIL